MLQGKKVIGHPVDVATGTVYSTHEDVSVPGWIPLAWERHYSTSILDQPATALGPGWTTRYFASLLRRESDFLLVTPEGEAEIFLDPQQEVARGGVIRNLGTFQELRRRGDHYVVTQWDIDTDEIVELIFEQSSGASGVCMLHSIEDGSGYALYLLRDAHGRLIEVQQRCEHRALVLEYTATGHIGSVSVRHADGTFRNRVHYEYDPAGRLVVATDPLGHVERYEYDDRSRIVREVQKDGADFHFKYDDRGRCIRTSANDGYVERTFRYLDQIRWTEVTDSQGHVYQYNWTPTGQVTTELDPTGVKKETFYDEYSRISERVAPNGSVTSYEYDEKGNRTRISGPLGANTIVVFNDHHQPVSMTNPLGGVSRRFYDSQGRLVATEDPLQNRWTLSYDGQGNLTRITNPNGASQSFTYSSDNELTGIVDFDGHRTEFTVDGSGRIEERIDERGNRTSSTHDESGNLRSVTYADGSRVDYQYTADRATAEIRDRNDGIRRWRFGGCKRVVEDVDRLGKTVAYEWNSEPNGLRAITNEKGERYEYDYDAAGRIVKKKAFSGQATEHSFDALGNCVKITNANGEETEYEYNELNLIVKTSFPDGSTAAFDYDPSGNVIKAVNDTVAVTLKRDLLGRVVKEVQGDHVIKNEYDSLGKLVCCHSSLGQELRFTYSNAGFLKSCELNGDHRIVLETDSVGRETRRLLPGGAELVQEYDAVGNLILQRVKEGPRLGASKDSVARRYSYSSAWLREIQDDQWGLLEYEFDHGERLLRAKSRRGQETFSYDDAGNITRVGLESRTGALYDELTYGLGNQLLRKGGTVYRYDDHGRRIQATRVDGPEPSEWTYEWDGEDQITAVAAPDGRVWRYRYDAFGRRVAKEGSDGDVGFVWLGDTVLHELKDQELESTWLFSPEDARPIAMIRSNRMHAVIADHLGTPRELINPDGRTTWSATFRAWGGINRETGDEVRCPIRFPGQWHDEESGLHYNRFRYYDPETGHFLCRDPVGLAGGLNEYLYTRNPINWIDPWGLTDECNGDSDGDKKKPDESAWDVANIPESLREKMRKKGLPGGGEVPFIPKPKTNKKGDQILDNQPIPAGPKKGDRGPIDSQDRVWRRHKDEKHGDHWDVQIDGGSDQLNINDDGSVNH